MQHYSLRIWAVNAHALDMIFLWALLYVKCPRSFSLLSYLQDINPAGPSHNKPH